MNDIINQQRERIAELEREKAELVAQVEVLRGALKCLSFEAQISGGVAGRNESLIYAVDFAHKVLVKVTPTQCLNQIIKDYVMGMVVSVDVSISEETAYKRIFAKIIEPMECSGVKNDIVLLSEASKLCVDDSRIKHQLEFHGENRDAICSCGKDPYHWAHPADSVDFDKYLSQIKVEAGRAGYVQAIHDLGYKDSRLTDRANKYAERVAKGE